MMAAVIFKQFTLQYTSLFISVLIKIRLDVPKGFCQILSGICNGPVYFHVKMCEGVPVFLLYAGILLNEEGIIYIQKLLNKIEEIRTVKMPQVLTKLPVKREFRKVLHVFFDHAVLWEKTNIIFQMIANGIFTENNEECIEIV